MQSCKVGGCDRPSFCHGMCTMHFQRWKKHGDPLVVKKKLNASPIERFKDNVQKSNDGCWLWTGGKGTFGYGVSCIKGKQVLAHRLSWAVHHGTIPKGKFVLHKCDNPPCVNPDHLFLGDNLTNIADKVSKKRHPRGETHGQAKLTEKQVRKILQSAGTQETIAKQYGVSQSLIQAIRAGKNWRHLTTEAV